MQKATVGGILAIVASSLGILTGLFFLLYPFLLGFMFNDMASNMSSFEARSFDTFMGVFMVVFIAIALFYVLIGALGIVGGIFAIKKQKFGLALAGAIASSISFYYLGIVAVVLVSMAQSEFNKGTGAPVVSSSQEIRT